jgi:two-component system OmpR family response regulator
MRSLVIEDEPQIGAYLGRLLGQLHGIVDIVASVSDARQALQEFLARVRPVLRRPRLLVPSVLSLGNFELYVGTNEVVVANNKVLLRRREALILGALLMRRDRVVTRAALIEATYGFDDEIESNSLEAQVSRLRKRLVELGGDVEIRSMRSIGYILRTTQIR